ncbi:hypothetical protein Pint_30399 [Pistacia integerrima]|uniref:Uncharacterized protein n=1 Tax=Pistacia integerrima TaxID=434235 RepID=A0ACC0WZU7_9ROSI|nr:hypothetical protein Pint_30399 [Pistacia integerrima]
MQWLKYSPFMYYGFRLLLKKGGLQEVWVLLAMALGYRICTYFCLRKRINICQL